MRIHLTHPEDLGAAELVRWRRLQQADRALAGPFFSPGYAQAVAAARNDARLLIIEDGGGIAGYFAAQRPSPFAAMPLGAPLTDVQGIVGAPSLAVRPADLCRALQVGRIDFAGVLASQAAFAGHHQGVAGSWIAEVGGGSAAYLAGLRARRNDTVRQQDKKRRKLAREHGEVVFSAMSRDRAHFEQVLAWKQAQSRRTNQPPVWETPWVLKVVNEAWESAAPDFAGALFTLTVGGRLVAGNFFLAGNGVLQDWIIAHDDAFNGYSPGIMLARATCEWAADNGFHAVDFGPGDYQYKRQLTTTTRDLAWGFAARPSLAAAVRGAQYGLRGLMEAAPIGRWSDLPGKAMRRLDVRRAIGAPLAALL